MGQAHDYRFRGNGHDYTFEPIDGGQRGRMMGWGAGIKAGDYLILESGPMGTRYIVDDISYYHDPADMWKAAVTFSPRRGAA